MTDIASRNSGPDYNKIPDIIRTQITVRIFQISGFMKNKIRGLRNWFLGD